MNEPKSKMDDAEDKFVRASLTATTYALSSKNIGSRDAKFAGAVVDCLLSLQVQVNEMKKTIIEQKTKRKAKNDEMRPNTAAG